MNEIQGDIRFSTSYKFLVVCSPVSLIFLHYPNALSSYPVHRKMPILKDCATQKHTQKVFYRIKKISQFNVIIPFVSVGEIVNTMIQKGKEDKIEDLITLLKDLRADTPPPDKNVIDLSSQILNEDDSFDTTDATIAAHAISDEDSSFFAHHRYPDAKFKSAKRTRNDVKRRNEETELQTTNY